MSDATDRDEVEELSAPYALDALSAEERQRYESALAASPELAGEARSLAETAARLGADTEPVAPSSAVKANIFALLDSTPQLREDAPAASAPKHSAAAPIDADARAEDAGAAASDRHAQHASRPVATGTAARTAHRRWFQRPGAIIGLAAAAVVLIAGAVVGIGWPGPNGWGAQREFATIADAPDAQRAQASATGGGTVTVVWSPEHGQSGVSVKDLPQLASDRTYELWYIDAAGARSAGTFVPGADGSTWRVLEGELPAGAAVGITVEPAGGSPQPTTNPIVVVAT